MGLSHPIKSKVLERYGNEKFKVGICSMQGFRPTMEDAHSVVLGLENHPEISFFGVFDGHNGSGSSKWLSSNLHKYFDKLPTIDDESIKNTCLEVDRDLINLITSNNLSEGGGSTAVFTFIEDTDKEGEYKITIGNIGDSRCILGRNSVESVPLTNDHKPDDEAEYARIVRAGGFVSMSRVNGTLALSRAFGDHVYKLNPNFPAKEQQVIAYPDITHEVLKSNDFLVICCDGIFEALTNNEVVEFISEGLKKTDDIALIASQLIDQSLEKESHDNMSVMIIKCVDGSNYTREKEFIPGYTADFVDSPQYMNSYIRFSMEHGFTYEESLQMYEQYKIKTEE